MDGKWGKWWLAPLFVAWIAVEWSRRHWRLLAAAVVTVVLLQLAGCTTPERIVQVRVPVPVACQVEEPQRPRLGIDTMPITAPIDVQIRNLRADHDARDGYERELRAALQACRTIGGPGAD